jgi:hypothetical protein
MLKYEKYKGVDLVEISFHLRIVLFVCGLRDVKLTDLTAELWSHRRGVTESR